MAETVKLLICGDIIPTEENEQLMCDGKIDELFGDRIEIRFRGAWNENDRLEDRSSEIWLAIPAEGLWLFDGETHGSAVFHATKVRHWSEGRYDVTETSHYECLRQGALDFSRIPVDSSSRASS